MAKRCYKAYCIFSKKRVAKLDNLWYILKSVLGTASVQSLAASKIEGNEWAEAIPVMYTYYQLLGSAPVRGDLGW